ncbi:ATP-binding protein [Streptomyces virginiae]|uniref:sensor histidine kinase n=1 Tax=Streptomyces virginiae TaxID=1961 RepID=UPI002DDA1436|nr:ATP-binding protein [Streptomyces virginiae]WSC81486.1 ATP-binding protein [Streptomyces virginiae]
MLPAIAVVTVACLAGALVSSSAPLDTALIAVGAVCTAAVFVEARRRGRALAAGRAQVAALQHALARQEVEAARLSESVLPEAIERLRKGELAEEVLTALGGRGGRGNRWGDDEALTPRFRAALQAVLAHVIDAVDNEESLRDSAQRAFVNVARRVQAIVHQQAHEMREMEDRHGSNPDVFGDLLRLDHGTALIGRLADSISVLGGARPGRQWSRAVTLYSVMRGAMSRIIDYQRVELHSVSEVAVVGPIVEPLIHTLAELLDNATRYSPPHTRVHLTAVEVQSGIAVEIEDGGLSMSEEARSRAEKMLAQAQSGIDLNDLGETPRLGLAVVGRLAQAYGFQVSLRSSAYGGVRAVVIVPQHLITTASSATGLAHGIGSSSGPRAVAATPREHPFDRASAGVAVPRPAPAPAPGPAPVGAGQPEIAARTATGLPQRRRKDRVATSDVRPAPEPRSADDGGPGMWLEAFHSGLSGTPGHDAPGTEGTSGSATKGA